MSKNILKITAITFSKTLLILNMLHRGLYFFFKNKYIVFLSMLFSKIK